MTDLTAIMLLDPSHIEKNQEKCNEIVRLLVTDQIKHDYPEGKQLDNLSRTFVVSYHDSFCYHGELHNYIAIYSTLQFVHLLILKLRFISVLVLMKVHIHHMNTCDVILYDPCYYVISGCHGY